ncbi:MAG: hypothetical protein BMS9Abin13_673 [Patescibacteria group bacterium]|nr:MAG: hypothetical protein BMS9Abin13_673 [Patescibacteria group bacterium]
MIQVVTINKMGNRRKGIFEVVVEEGAGKTVHTVFLEKAYYEMLTDGVGLPEDLIKRSFEFLLEREPKESILKKFDLKTISRYFPEYEAGIAQTYRD